MYLNVMKSPITMGFQGLARKWAGNTLDEPGNETFLIPHETFGTL